MVVNSKKWWRIWKKSRIWKKGTGFWKSSSILIKSSLILKKGSDFQKGLQIQKKLQWINILYCPSTVPTVAVKSMWLRSVHPLNHIYSLLVVVNGTDDDTHVLYEKLVLQELLASLLRRRGQLIKITSTKIDKYRSPLFFFIIEWSPWEQAQ